MKCPTWVTAEGKELSIKDLEEMKQSFINKWQKCENEICILENKRRTCEDVVRGCQQRIRILKIITGGQDEKTIP